MKFLIEITLGKSGDIKELLKKYLCCTDLEWLCKESAAEIRNVDELTYDVYVNTNYMSKKYEDGLLDKTINLLDPMIDNENVILVYN